MSTPVLTTKLFAPSRRPQLLARPRLSEQLDTALEPGQRLTLVSAPAGFGKTTVLSEWLTHLDQRRSRTRVGWLSLDEADNDLARFLVHLMAALSSAALDLDLDPVVLEQTLPDPAVLTALVPRE